MNKTVINDYNELKCKGCDATTPFKVDRARAAGWRVPWTPGEPVWCPTCWKPPRDQVTVTAQPYDEPMF